MTINSKGVFTKLYKYFK